MFPKLGGNKEGELGDFSCLSLRHRGRIHCLPLSGKKEWQMDFIQEALRPFSWSSKHGGKGCLHCFLMSAPPWGVAPIQEVPWAWADAQPHPDKGQLWSCDGHPVWLGQLLLGGRGALPSLMWFRPHPFLPPCIILCVWREEGGGRLGSDFGPVIKEP